MRQRRKERTEGLKSEDEMWIGTEHAGGKRPYLVTSNCPVVHEQRH